MKSAIALRGAGLAALVLLLACGGGGMTPSPPQPSPSPSPPPGPGDVTPGQSTGPTRITFAGADPPPGSAVGGCGPSISGCRGRVTIRLALLSPGGGPILYTRVFLHDGATLRACLIGQSGPRTLRAGVTETVEVVLDDADDCRTPVDIRTMAAVVEGTIEVASRQDWGIRYTFLP
jgi:hypothetical protein